MKTRTLQTRRASILLLCALVSSYAFVCMTRNCFSSAMVFIVDAGYLNNLQTGIINAAFYVLYAIFQVIGGFLTDKLHPERFVTFGLLGAGACNLLIFFNQSYPVMLTMWALNGVLQFGVWPAIFKLASTMTVPEMRRRSLFIVTFANPIGVLANYLVAALIGANWRLNFLVSALGLGVIAVLFEGTMRAIRTDAVECEIAPEKEKQGDGFVRNSRFATLLFSSGLVFLLALAFIRTGFDFATKSLTPTMIKQSYADVTPVLATLLNIIVLVMNAVGTALAYVIYPRFIKNEATVLLVLFLIALPPTCITLFVGEISYWLILLCCALIAMMMGAATLFTTSYIGARFNRFGYGATVAGLLNCLSSLGIVVSFTLFPALSESRFGWQGVSVTWVILMALAVALCAVILPLWRKFIKEQA